MNKKLIGKIILPKPPVYDYKESVIEYSRKFDEYIQNLTKIKYDIILKFLNIWLNHYSINISRLIDFKFINIDTVTKDKKYNDKILRLYSQQLNKYFNIEEEESYSDINSDDIEENEIIVFLKKLLDKIDYTIIKKNKDKKILYFIINKKMKD